MSNSQPSNATISIFRRAKTYFNNGRHTSIKHLTTPFDGKLVSVPGEETLVLETRNASFRTDAFQFGHPVVVYPRTVETLPKALADIADLNVVKMPGNEREVQIEPKPVAIHNDLYGQLQADQAGGYHS